MTGFPLEMLPVQLGGMCEARRAQGEKLGLGPGGEAGARAWGDVRSLEGEAGARAPGRSWGVCRAVTSEMICAEMEADVGAREGA